VEYKPASSFVVSLSKALNNMPLSLHGRQAVIDDSGDTAQLVKCQVSN